jgi:hypothetical protein
MTHPRADGPRSLVRPSPPWLAEIEERLASLPSFFESITPEQRAMREAYDGPEVIGPPPPPPMKRRPRRRGEV